MKKFFISLVLLTFVFIPIGNVVGFDSLDTDHAYAVKKKMTQKTFNKQAASLSKKIQSYKSEENDLMQQLSEERTYNAENFASLFEDETLGLSDDEVLAYYIDLVSKFVDREDDLEEYFYQEEIDVISDYMYDIQATNKKINTLKSKIKSYETNYKRLSKSKKYEEALKVRNNEIKAYSQLIDVLESGITLESNLYSDTQDIFNSLYNYEEELDDTEDTEDIEDSEGTEDPADDGSSEDGSYSEEEEYTY